VGAKIAIFSRTVGAKIAIFSATLGISLSSKNGYLFHRLIRTLSTVKEHGIELFPLFQAFEACHFPRKGERVRYPEF
jgi:hypothetical protein